jgi:predicted nucleic acid-binding protein
MRVVVDTSLWIDYNRGDVEPEERARLEQVWREGRVVLYQFVWLELIVGYRSPKEQRTLRDYREMSRWEAISADDGVKAEAFARILREQGHTVGASDLLILAAADRLGAQLAHHDSDFDIALKNPQLAHLRWISTGSHG